MASPVPSRNPEASDELAERHSALLSLPLSSPPLSARSGRPPHAFKATLPPGVDHLGITPGSLPPNETVISDVEPGSWAYFRGVRPGDTLLEVNRVRTTSLSEEELDRMLSRMRPLQLIFCHPEGEEGKADSSQALAPMPASSARTPQSPKSPPIGRQVLDGREIWPQHWGITRQQCMALLQRLREDQAWDPSGNIYDLVERVLVPETRGTGLGYALLQNKALPKEVNVLVSHPWCQPAEELLEAICRSTSSTDVMFVSALSLYHAEDDLGPSLQAQLGENPTKSLSSEILSHIKAKGKDASNDAAWRRRELLETVPVLLLFAGLFSFWVPIVIQGCVTSWDGATCSARRLQVRSGGGVEAYWVASQGTGFVSNVSFNRELLISAILLLSGLTSYYVLRNGGIYRGRLLVVPTFNGALMHRLWCVFEVFVAKAFKVPVSVSHTPASLGRWHFETAVCTEAKDQASIRRVILSNYVDQLPGVVFMAGWRMLSTSWISLRWVLLVTLFRAADLRLASAATPQLLGEQGMSWFYPALIGVFLGVLGVGVLMCKLASVTRGAPRSLDFFWCGALLLLAYVDIIVVFVLAKELRPAEPAVWGDIMGLLTEECFGYLRPGDTLVHGCSRNARFWAAFGQTLALGGLILLALMPFLSFSDHPTRGGRLLQYLCPALLVALILTATAADVQAAEPGSSIFEAMVFWITALLSRSFLPFFAIWRGMSSLGVNLRSARYRPPRATARAKDSVEAPAVATPSSVGSTPSVKARWRAAFEQDKGGTSAQGPTSAAETA